MDTISGLLLFSMIVFTPWACGTTTTLPIWTMNTGGFLLGAFWIGKCLYRRLHQYAPVWIEGSIGSVWPIRFTGAGTIFLLAYVLVSTLNPNSEIQYTYDLDYAVPTGIKFTHFWNPILWLPHSFDGPRTLRAFWKYLAMTLSFWAARDWLLTCSRNERKTKLEGILKFPTDRIQVLLWTLSINTAALALEGILQRLDKTQLLLWYFPNHENAGDYAFGPFPYQSNGAQYLNLMWPVMLGFWWVQRGRNLEMRGPSAKGGGESHVILPVLIGLVAAGVFVAQSKIGFALMAAMLAVGFLILWLFSQHQRSIKFLLMGMFGGLVALGGWVGGESLRDRFLGLDLQTWSGRKEIYQHARQMQSDFQVFGSGAETFMPLYYVYRDESAEWAAYAHDDFMETRITLGWIGFGTVVSIFGAIWGGVFAGRGIGARREFLLLFGLALGGLMAHSAFDLPFQIYAIHFQFLILCALATCLRWQR